MTPGAWADVGPLADFPAFEPRLVRVGGRRIAVVRTADAADGLPTLAAFDDACPHAADPLSGGFCVENRLVCRAHGWAFDLSSGRCTAGERSAALKPWTARARDGRVEIAARPA